MIILFILEVIRYTTNACLTYPIRTRILGCGFLGSYLSYVNCNLAWPCKMYRWTYDHIIDEGMQYRHVHGWRR